LLECEGEKILQNRSKFLKFGRIRGENPKKLILGNPHYREIIKVHKIKKPSKFLRLGRFLEKNDN